MFRCLCSPVLLLLGPPGNRVLRDTVYVGCGEDEPVPIDFTKKYSVGMHVYMASGKVCQSGI